MKLRDSRPLRTIGSLTLCRSLLEAGVVDHFRVVVYGRLQLLEYVPTVLDGPPGVGN